MYINSALSVLAAFAWTPAPAQAIPQVSSGDRCIYNGTGWDIIKNGVDDIGVATVTGVMLLSKSTHDDAANPVVRTIDAGTTCLPLALVQLADS